MSHSWPCVLYFLSAVSLLMLANRFAVSRLVTLCELYLSKLVERETKDDIAKADVDIIGILSPLLPHFSAATYMYFLDQAPVFLC